ncbi:MAG: hypothetical protein NTX03_09905 [Bacteroidetes bacterium]|nr:hypothetical protein [Bacteroidota bacterium]
MKRYLLNIAFLLIIISFSNCEKYVNHHRIDYHKIYGEVLANVKFPAGSWWVYKDVGVSGEIDSVVCNYSIIQRIKVDEETYYDKLKTAYTHYRKNDTLYFEGEGSYNFYLETGKTNEGKKSDFPLMYYEFTGMSTVDLHEREGLKINSINRETPYQIGGVWYNDALTFYLTQNDYNNERLTELSWAKSIGIVRREHYSGRAYTLQRFHINN